MHLFELEDQPWFPAVIRDAGTAYLGLAWTASGQIATLVPTVRQALERSGARRIVDLCSGGAGPIPALVEALGEQGIDVEATLTDLFPSEEVLAAHGARDPRISVAPEPIDARCVPGSLPGLRTMFNALHHFRPTQARAILQGAVDDGQPFCAMELVSRHPLHLLSTLFIFLPVMLAVPFLRPFRWAWVPLTYVIPVIPLFVMWDGFVSCLRVYSPDELRALVARLDGGERFDWEIGTLPLALSSLRATYVVGVPRGDAPLRPVEPAGSEGGRDASSPR